MDIISSIRYGAGTLNLRTRFLKIAGWLQGRKVVVLDHDPVLCAKVLASSETKGFFIEHLFAIPSWSPIYSIESEDGETWKDLATNCRTIFRTLNWKATLPSQVESEVKLLATKMETDQSVILDAEQISRLTLRVLYEILFGEPIKEDDELLFYKASMEWRKEIAVRGHGDVKVKSAFSTRLMEIIKLSKFSKGLYRYPEDPVQWLSVFAQPFILSPQINISDVMESIFSFLNQGNNSQYEEALKAALAGNISYLNAVIMESMRLKHPFPILERELGSEIKIEGKTYPTGTQVFITLDNFVQAPQFNPANWLIEGETNPFEYLAFGAGKRICLGKVLAKNLIQEMLRSILIHIPVTKIQPSSGHVFSGRDNDHMVSYKESIYQICRFWGALCKCFKIGLHRRSGTCPFRFK